MGLSAVVVFGGGLWGVSSVAVFRMVINLRWDCCCMCNELVFGGVEWIDRVEFGKDRIGGEGRKE